MCSFFGSMTKRQPGSRVISWIPPRFFFSFSISFWSSATSFLGSFSKVPSVDIFSSVFRRSMPLLMVLKLVSVPPSQRLVT